MTVNDLTPTEYKSIHNQVVEWLGARGIEIMPYDVSDLVDLVLVESLPSGYCMDHGVFDLRIISSCPECEKENDESDDH